MVICRECSNNPEFSNFFDFAKHIINEHDAHELKDWAIRESKTSEFIKYFKI